MLIHQMVSCLPGRQKISRKPKYLSLNYNEDLELDANGAYTQAARALDILAEDAVQSRDCETLTAVASLWIRIAENLSGGPSEVHNDTPPLMGFVVPDEEENDED